MIKTLKRRHCYVVHFFVVVVTVSLKQTELRTTIFIILTGTWYPKLNAIRSILKNNLHLIFNDAKLSKIFKQKPVVAYQKKLLLNQL